MYFRSPCDFSGRIGIGPPVTEPTEGDDDPDKEDSELLGVPGMVFLPFSHQRLLAKAHQVHSVWVQMKLTSRQTIPFGPGVSK